MADVPLHELRRLWEEARRRGVDLSPEQLCGVLLEARGVP
jgi:hypothetical protein